MTIYDLDTEVTVTSLSTATAVTYSSDTYDLTGGSDGVPQLFGGGQLYMQFEVTTAFTNDTGTPVGQFGIALGDTAPLDGDAHVLALTGGSIDTQIGMDKDQLTLGRTFHLAIPSWEDIMEIKGALWPDTTTTTTLANFRLFRYMGIVLHQPKAIASHFFDAGVVKARITTQASVGTAVKSNIYPSRMTVN